MNEGRDSPVPHIENQRSGSPAVPPTPLLWFEFLLKPGLLETHLKSDNPEPTATQLLEQFVDQSIKEANNEESPTQLRKIHSLKVLALKVAAHLKWDFSYLQTSLPLYMVHKVLKDFVEWVSPPELNIQPTTDVCSLDDSVLVALAIYNRWSVRTFVERSVPAKLIKHPAGNIQGAFNVAGVNDMVMKTVKDTLPDSLNFLERCLPLNRDVFFPSAETFIDAGQSTTAEPTSSPSPHANNRPPLLHQHHRGNRVTKEEFLWQLNFDLGCYCFQQQQYGKAADHFQRVQELLPKVETTFYCRPDEAKLRGYLAACSALVGQDLNKLPSSDPKPLLSRCEASKANNYQGIVAILQEDNAKQEFSAWYRESLGSDIARSAGTPPLTKRDVWLCNAARLAAEGRSKVGDIEVMLQNVPSQTRGFFAECVVQTASASNARQMLNIRSLVATLCRNEALCKVLLGSKLGEMYSQEEREAMQAAHIPRDRTQARAEGLLGEKPTDNLKVRRGQLELRLLQTLDPLEVETILRTLHTTEPNRRFSAVCSKWQVDRTYGFIIENMANRLSQDYLFILLVKAQHCIDKKSYDTAIQLLEAACKATKETFFHLYTGLQNEILYSELLRLAEQRGAKAAGPDFTQRVLACLMSTRAARDIPLREPVLNECILFLLNTQYWLCFFNADIPLAFWRVSKFISLCMKDDPSDAAKCRTVAKDLWGALLQVFSTTSQIKRTNTGANANTLNRDSGLAIMTKAELLSFVRGVYDDRCLSLLLSCLIKMTNLLKDDAASEISHDYPALWPNTITNVGSVNTEAVASSMNEVLSHALTIDPKNPSWLCSKADSCFAKKQYGAALKFYLQAGLVSTHFFETLVPRSVWSDQVYRRCIKACTALQCHTQAAILCQFLQPVDYSTAYQSLQEKRCYDGCDALYDYIWDLAILEYLVYTHHKRSEVDKKQAALQVLSQPELNTCNSEVVLAGAARKRQKRFLQSMAKQYL